MRRKAAMATAEAKIHVSEFTNEPFIDFSKPENRKAMEDALKKVASEFGREYPMYLGGQKVVTIEKRTRRKLLAFSKRPLPKWPRKPWKPPTRPLNPGSAFPPISVLTASSALPSCSANANLK
jgi:hypothetical protein